MLRNSRLSVGNSLETIIKLKVCVSIEFLYIVEMIINFLLLLNSYGISIDEVDLLIRVCNGFRTYEYIEEGIGL